MDKSVEGKRVKLVYTDDPHTGLKPGDMGTAQFWNRSNYTPDTLAVKWDSGSTLSLIKGHDRWEWVEQE
jgi:hypothetical protein